MLYVPASYTVFQMGWKYFFVTASILVWLTYTVLLWGSKDANGARFSTSFEQNYVWALGFMLIWFNDPSFAASVLHPNFGISAFYALCVVTFLTLLLMFWAIYFHIAVLQSEGGSTWTLDGHRNKLGLWFWIPKIIFACIFYLSTLTLYLFSRYMQLTDASYNMGESLQSPIGEYFTSIVFIIVGLYILYLFVLLVLGCRNIKRMRRGYRFFIAMTLITFVIIIVGLYMNAFTSTRSTSGTYLMMYGVANIYVWLLQLSYLPSAAPDQQDADTTGVMGNGDHVNLEEDNDVSHADVHITEAVPATEIVAKRGRNDRAAKERAPVASNNDEAEEQSSSAAEFQGAVHDGARLAVVSKPDHAGASTGNPFAAAATSPSDAEFAIGNEDEHDVERTA
jgi:hypothetical protein